MQLEQVNAAPELGYHVAVFCSAEERMTRKSPQVGLVIGFLVGLVVGGALGAQWMRSRCDAEGWRRWHNQMNMVAFNQDLPAGAVITVDRLRRVRIDLELTTESQVRTSEVDQILGGRLRYPVRQGDLVQDWIVEPPTATQDGGATESTESEPNPVRPPDPK